MPPGGGDRKGKSRAGPIEGVGEMSHYPPARESERWTAANSWRASRRRAKEDKRGWDHGGFFQCLGQE